MTGDVGAVGLVQKRDGSRLSSHVKIRMPISMDMFQKAPPANFIGCFIPGDCWIKWDSVGLTRVFI
jgi:hypothetical protein